MQRLALSVVAAIVALAAPAAPRIAEAAGCGAAGTPTATVYLPNITKTLGGPTGWVTPFIVQNVGTAATTLEVSFYRFSDGSLVTCRSLPGILPGTSFADVPNNDADLPDDSQFSVVVRSFGSQVVSVVNEHQGAGTRAEALSYVALGQGSTSVALPYAAKAKDGWTTTIVLQNLGSATATVTAAFASADGTRTATLTRTVESGRSQFIDPTVETTLVSGTEYAVLLTSTQPIAAVANAHNDAPSVARPMGLSYNGIAVGTSGSLYLPYVARNSDGSRTTRVLVQNVGSVDARPTLTFHSANGQRATLTAPAAIRPGRAWSFDPRYLADGTTACPTAGTSACAATGQHGLMVSGGSFAVLGVTLSTPTGMGMTAQRPATSRLYLPNITRTLGGASGWTTPIVLQSAGATSAVLRWYRFADGTLAVTQYVPDLVSGATVRIDPRDVAGLQDATQYAVVVDAAGGAAAAVLELSELGGDGAMSYEGFAATGTVSAAPAPASITLSPTSASVGVGSTQQFGSTVKDRSGNVMIGVPLTWSVSPSSLGTISASGLFTAGSATGTGTVTARFGSLSATASISVAAQTATVGGFTFTWRATSSADVYTERTITSADATTIATTVDADVANIQSTYGRTFSTRPPVYVFATTSSYTRGLQTVFGLPAVEAATAGAWTSGLFRSSSTIRAVALDWAKIEEDLPYMVPRHELTHMMIDQIAKPTADGVLPAWINEGTARQQEFTISGTDHWEMQNRYGAASMVAVRDYYEASELASQEAWNARTGEPGTYQYYEASQIVQLLRDDIGQSKVIRILERVGQGESFDAAFLAVAGRSRSSFESTVPSRLQAISSFYPEIATASDEPGDEDGLSYMLYGFWPDSSVTIEIVGEDSGFENTTKSWTVDSYGTLFLYFGAGWPADTYSITATGLTPPGHVTPGKSVTVGVTAVKSSSILGASLTR